LGQPTSQAGCPVPSHKGTGNTFPEAAERQLRRCGKTRPGHASADAHGNTAPAGMSRRLLASATACCAAPPCGPKSIARILGRLRSRERNLASGCCHGRPRHRPEQSVARHGTQCAIDVNSRKLCRNLTAGKAGTSRARASKTIHKLWMHGWRWWTGIS